MTDQRTLRPPERPRDRFGRPLPWGSVTEIDFEDYASLTREANHALGIAHFNASRFFQAHEAWEEAWRKASNSPDEAFFKGLAQLGAAYTHYVRGNAHGARVLLERALERIALYGPAHLGLDVAGLTPRFQEQATAFALAEATQTPPAAVRPPEL